MPVALSRLAERFARSVDGNAGKPLDGLAGRSLEFIEKRRIAPGVEDLEFEFDSVRDVG